MVSTKLQLNLLTADLALSALSSLWSRAMAFQKNYLIGYSSGVKVHQQSASTDRHIYTLLKYSITQK